MLHKIFKASNKNVLKSVEERTNKDSRLNFLF